MKKSNPWFHKILLTIYILAIVWTLRTHTARKPYPVEASSIPAAAAPASVRVISYPISRRRFAVRAYVQRAARTAGVNPRVAEWIVTHESHQQPEATGDGGESRGIWQINKAWHPEVSDACAYNVPCSTAWSLHRIRAGYADEWSTWKYCRTRFNDCPF
ncbi:MAG TPA: transglycosylase SLT domain-containing protein [Candidatus Dormibacteraeota bacterium]|nr:transglycosylase SLT domain-containing protein [Candidatus Dormibacteraeota bacterium]